jgi:hypothetical protein
MERLMCLLDSGTRNDFLGGNFGALHLGEGETYSEEFGESRESEAGESWLPAGFGLNLQPVAMPLGKEQNTRSLDFARDDNVVGLTGLFGFARDRFCWGGVCRRDGSETRPHTNGCGYRHADRSVRATRDFLTCWLHERGRSRLHGLAGEGARAT